MEIIKLTKDDIISNKTTLNKNQIFYDTALVNSWESGAKKSFETLQNYNTKLNNQEYLSSDDLKSYKSAMNSYIENNNRLRKLNKIFGQGYTDVQEKEWNDAITSLQSGYKEMSDYFSKFKDENEFKKTLAAIKQQETMRAEDQEKLRIQLEEKQRAYKYWNSIASDPAIKKGNINNEFPFNPHILVSDPVGAIFDYFDPLKTKINFDQNSNNDFIIPNTKRYLGKDQNDSNLDSGNLLNKVANAKYAGLTLGELKKQIEEDEKYLTQVRYLQNYFYLTENDVSLDELKSHLSDEDPIAYTHPVNGENITWQKLYKDKKYEQELDAWYEKYSSLPDWNEFSAFVSQSKHIEDLRNGADIEDFGTDLALEYIYGDDEFRALLTTARYGHAASKDNMTLMFGSAETYGTRRNYDYGEQYGYDSLNNKETAVYTYLRQKLQAMPYEEQVNSEEFDALNEFERFMGDKLIERHNEKEVQDAYKIAQEHSVGSSLMSIGYNLQGGFEFLTDAVLGEIDDGNHSAAMGSAIRQGVSDTVDWEIGNFDAFDFLYNTGMSMADSLASTALLGKAGGIALGLSAAGQGVNDALDRGLSSKQAFWNGLASGTFEMIFETVSIGQFSALKESLGSGIKNIAKNIGKSMLVNASEETLTEIANIVYDTVMNTDFSDYETKIRAYVASGMTPEEAEQQVKSEMTRQVAEAAASGALMGFGFGVIGNMSSSRNASQYGEYYYGFSQKSVYALVNNGLAMPEGSVAHSQATKADAKLKSGKSLSGTTLYNLATAIKSEIETKSEARLGELDVGKKTVKELAPVVAKTVFGEQLTSQEYETLKNNEIAAQVVMELSADGVNTVWKDAIKNSRINDATGSNAVTEQGEILQSTADGGDVQGADGSQYYGNGDSDENFLESADNDVAVGGEYDNAAHLTTVEGGASQQERLPLSQDDISLALRENLPQGEAGGSGLFDLEFDNILLENSTKAVTKPLSSYAPAKRGMIIDFLKAVDEKLKAFVERVKNGSNKFERFSICDVSGREAADIKDLLGIDIDGYTHNINTSGIKHILKRHGVNGNHDHTMSNDNDIARMGWVIKNYDKVELLFENGEFATSGEFKDKANRPAPQIRYSKKINGIYYVVEAVFENNYNKLWVQSAYLKNNKEVVTQDPDAANRLPMVTSETPAASPTSYEVVTQDPAESQIDKPHDHAQSALASPTSNNNISQSQKSVNDEYWGEKSKLVNAIYVENGSTLFDLTEPTQKDIARAPTAEESIAAAISGEELDTKQLRISDFVKKHFPEITLKFSGNMTKGGLWDTESKTLLLNTDQMVAGMYIEVLKHEFMHRLESKRLYQEFKQFLFNKDVAFGVWAKVQCKVHGIKLQQNATAKDAINSLADYYYNSVKNDMSIAKKYRDAFTIDGAQREMVADFFGEIMFNGKKYRTQTAQALADETLLTMFDENEKAEFEANSMAALQEIAEYKPNIFQQIVDWVKRIILKLRGTRIRADKLLADELERNIKILEDYVKQVYNSNDLLDIKYESNIKYKLINNQFPPYNQSQSDANEWATRWAQSIDVETGDKKLVSYHNRWYLIEKFDDVEFGYRIIERATKSELEYFKERYGDVRKSNEKSDASAIIGSNSPVGKQDGNIRSNLDFNSVFNRHGRKNDEVFHLDQGKLRSTGSGEGNDRIFGKSGQRNSSQSRNSSNTVTKNEATSLPEVAFNYNIKKAAENSGGVRYSIINLDTGKSYVQASRQVISGNSVAEWRSQISDFFNKSLRNGPIEITTIEGDTLTISKDTANKARSKTITENGVIRELTDKEFLVKLNAEAHIDELAEISISKKDKKGNKKIVPDNKNHDIAKDGFSYRTVYFQDFDDSYYRITLSVGENNGISTVYNVGKIKADDIPDGNIISTIGSKADMSSAEYSISNPDENVNTEKNNGVRYSLSDIEIPTREQLESKGAVKVIDISVAKTKGTYAERRSQIKREMQNIISVPYLNKDTQTMIFLTTKSYEHAFSNSGGIQLNAAEHLPELIENAVLTHAEGNTHGSEYATGVYTFFAAVKADKIRPVKLKVKEFSYRGQELPKNIKEYFDKNPQDYAASYDTVVLEVEEIEESSIGSVKDIDENNLFLDPNELSEVSIADLLNLVNGSAKKYVPDRIVTNTESNDNSNDIAPSQNSLSNNGEQSAKKYGDYAVSSEDIRLEARDDIAPLPENAESDIEYPDDYAPIGEGVVENDTEENDAEIDSIIKTLKDSLAQKRRSYETERKNLTEKRQETLSNIDTKIAEAQAKYDGKKNKDTRTANTLLRRIESLKTRKANIEADYAKRLNNLDSSNARTKQDGRGNIGKNTGIDEAGSVDESAFSIPVGKRQNSIEKYSEEQYNDFGWVRYNEVLTVSEYNTLLSRYADYKHNKNQYPTTRFGEAVIHSSECPDVLMYVKGKIENPEITKVVRINADEGWKFSFIKEEILKNEYRRQLLPFQFVEGYFGQGILVINKARDYGSYREYERRLVERGNSREIDTVSGAEQYGRGSVGKDTGIDEAGSVDESAFSVPKDYTYETLINKPDVKITEIDSFNGQINNDTRRHIIDKAVENAAIIGKRNDNGNAVVYVNDIDTNIILSKSSLRHSIDRRFELLAPVLLKSGEILKNSIRINELMPRYDNISKSYVLIGVAKNAKNEPYIISFVVNKVTSEVSAIDVLYAINAKTEPAGSLSPSVPASIADYFTDSTISISKLLDYVNKYFPDILPESVLRHYGYEARPKGKMGESALFSMPIGKRKSNIGESVIELSKYNELSKRIGNLRGSEKYKVIQQYILDVLSGEEIVLSDGKIAVVDRSDALHIANKSGYQKTAEISAIKELVKNAILVAEEESTKKRKFDHFSYYEATVRYDSEVFNIYLNVGRATNDKSYHLYDITQKLRDTAHRFNDVGRPKPNEGYALETVSLNNIISKNDNYVNDDYKTITDNVGHEALNAKEQSYIEKICNKLGISVVFEDLREMYYKGEIISPDGYIEKDKGIIHLNLYAENPIGFIFKHELTHFAEKAKGYFEFVKQVKRSSIYQKWLAEKTGESDIRIAEYKYKQMVVKAHSDIDSVTDPKAEAEMIADFVAEMLFTESGSGMMAIANELNIKQRNAVVRFVLDFISYLKKRLNGISGTTFELSKLEDRFNELLSDAKNNSAYDNDIRFSLKIKHTDGTIEELADARNLTNEQAVEYLDQARRGRFKWNSYIPIRKDTPATIIDTLEAVDIVAENRSLIMQVRKAQQAMSAINNGGKSKKHGSNVRNHAMSAKQIVEIINNLDNPTAMILQTNRYNQYGEELPDNVAVFVEYNIADKEGVAIVEFDSSIATEFIGKEYGDADYHTVVTIFEPDTERGGMPFDYIEELLSNPDNYELEIVRKQPARSATGEKHPNTSSELPSNDIILVDKDNVKHNGRQPAKSAIGKKRPNTSSELPSNDIIENSQKKVKDNKTPSGQYSLGSPLQHMRYNLENTVVEKYSEEQYNNFGWVRYNKVLTSREYGVLLSRYADYKHNKNQYPTTRSGEAVIHSSECPDVLMYVKGRISNPQITKILRINIDEYNASVIKEDILHYEYRQIPLPYKDVEIVYGEGILDICKKQDFIPFREYRSEQERRTGETDSSNARTKQDGRGSVGKNTGIDEAGSVDEFAFSILVGKRRDTSKSIAQKQCRYIEKICNKLGISVAFEDLREMYHKGEIISPDGYIEKDKGIIHLNLYGENPIGFIFKHELTHFAEKAKGYFEFVKQVKRSSIYQKWLAEKTGESDIRIAEYKYKQMVAKTHSDIDSVTDPKAEAEMIADFVAEMLFTENGSGMVALCAEYEPKQRNVIVEYVLRFVSFLKKKLTGQRYISLELSMLEDGFRRLIFESAQLNDYSDLSNVYDKSLGWENGSEISFCFAHCDDKNKTRKARQMEKIGADRIEIYKELGIFRNVFGFWVYALDLKGYKFYPYGSWNTSFNLTKKGNIIEGSLEDIVIWPELFEKFPEFKSVKIVIKNSESRYDTVRFISNGESGTIFLNQKLCDAFVQKKDRAVKAEMLKAIQRMIQIKEQNYIGHSYEYWKRLESKGKLPFSRVLDRHLTADDMMIYFADNYDAEMAFKRQYIKNVVSIIDQNLGNLDNALEYIPYVNPDLVMVYNRANKLVTLREKDAKSKKQIFANDFKAKESYEGEFDADLQEDDLKQELLSDVNTRIMEKGDASEKIKAFVLSKEQEFKKQQQIRRDNSIKGGNSGFLEKGIDSDDVAYDRFAEQYDIVSKISVANNDTVGRKVNHSVREKLNGSFALNEKGEPISVYIISFNGKNVFKQAQIGLLVSTIDNAIGRYNDANREGISPRDIVCFEFYTTVKNPFYFKGEPYELSVGELGIQFVDKGIITWREYLKLLDTKSAKNEPSYRNNAMKKLRELIINAGFDSIVFENQTNDPGSMTLVVLDESQLIPVARDGVLIKETGIKDAVYQNDNFDPSVTSAGENLERLIKYIKEPQYNRRTARKQIDSRIRLGDADFLENTEMQESCESVNERLWRNSKKDLSGYDISGYKFNRLALKEFENCAFRDAFGNVFDFCIWSKNSIKIESAVKNGMEFGTVNSSFEKFFNQKQLTPRCYDGVFEAFILNCVKPLVVNLEKWNTVEMAKFLRNTGEITQMYYDKLFSLSSIDNQTYSSFAAQTLRSKIEMLGYDCILFVKKSGEKTVVPFNINQIFPISKNGILNSECDIFEPQKNVANQGIDGAVINYKARTVRDFSEVKDIILSEPNATRKLAHLTEFMSYSSHEILDDSSNLNIGYSGWFERGELNIWRAISVYNKLISDVARTAEIAACNTADQPIREQVREILRNTIFKDEYGKPLSFFLWNKYGKNRFKYIPVGCRVGTLTAAHDAYLAEREKHPTLTKGEYEEFLINASNPYLMRSMPEKFTAREFATEFYESGIISEKEYNKVLSFKGVDATNYYGAASGCLNRILKKKGLDCIIYMSKTYDPGSMGIIVLDESGLIPISQNGKATDNYFEFADSEEPAFFVPENENENFVEKDNENIFDIDNNSGYNETNLGGLSYNEKIKVKQKTGWSDEIIDYIYSIKEAQIYIDADLKEAEINGRKCLIRSDIDMEQIDKNGVTNRERIKSGESPINVHGEKIVLHHIGQKHNSPLAELTETEHSKNGNDGVLHNKKIKSKINRNKFNTERREHWCIRYQN